jgi:hypothetical protein
MTEFSSVTFTPLENPAIYGGDEIDVNSTYLEKREKSPIISIGVNSSFLWIFRPLKTRNIINRGAKTRVTIPVTLQYIENILSSTFQL